MVRAQIVGHEIVTIPLGDTRYPAALAAVYDPPPIIWTRGCADSLNGRIVAIVGSRAASPYALEVARTLAADLARRGITIASGMARGVDSAAHRGALDAGGATIAVFGCGVDVIYPPEHGSLAREICERGALVSEFPPATPPRAEHFPQRNRIISGMSRAVIVVEAAEKSGSLITARFALEQGRDVLAVPGNVLGGRNSGAHALLKDGARLVETANDVLDEMGLVTGDSGLVAGSPTTDSASKDPILSHMTLAESYDLDELADRCGLDRIRLLQRLLELELAGAVRRIAGGRFVRFGGPC